MAFAKIAKRNNKIQSKPHIAAVTVIANAPSATMAFHFHIKPQPNANAAKMA